MIRVRPAGERGHFNHGWLETYHSFSFGDYYDPAHMGFGALRVLNEDVVAPGSGFPRHAHRDMEILTYVLRGELKHADSLGNAGAIRAGEVQRMTAGRGILHSEANDSTEPVHLLQIWITPERRGLTPSYEQLGVEPERGGSGWRVIAAPDGRDGAATIHQDAVVLVGRVEDRGSIHRRLVQGRRAWVQATRGALRLDGVPLRAGDGAAADAEPELTIEADEPGGAEVLVFDLA
jgi:redox-sensitive bicupin YhaK (pirin superfamily)